MLAQMMYSVSCDVLADSTAVHMHPAWAADRGFSYSTCEGLYVSYYTLSVFAVASRL